MKRIVFTEALLKLTRLGRIRLSDLVEEQRMKNRVYNREALAVENEDDCDCHDEDIMDDADDIDG